jgi:tensin
MGTISQNGYASHSGTLQSQSGTLRAQQAGTAMVHHQYSSAPADKPGLVNASVQITSLGPDETIGIEGAGTKSYSSTTERTGSHAVQGSLQGSGRQGYSQTFERGQTTSSGYQGAGQQGYAHTIERSQSVQGAPLSGQQNFAHTIERSHSVQGAPLSTIQQPMTQHSYQTSEQSAHSSRSAHEIQGGHMGVTSAGGSAGQQLGQVEYQHGHVQDQMSMHGTGQHQQSYSQVQAQHMASHKGAIQSHHDGMQNGTMETLTVDTSHRGFSSGLPRSPSSGGSQAYSPSSLGSANMLQRRQAESGALTPGASSMTGERSPYLGHSRSTSFSSIGDGNDTLTHGTPRFVRDTSKFWYKPHISRDEAISLLKDKPAGTFVVRDSNSFPGAFGLALKVAHVPPNVQMKPGDQPGSELVRHFLIEPTPKGVKLKGCSNEPVFGSLAALVYQHSITPLALPCKLLLPEADPADLDSPDGKVKEVLSSPSQLLSQGAACNVLYINSIDTESLTGPEAVAKAVKETFAMNPPPKDTVVHFKVNLQGLTLTDNKRRLFFRRHYPINTVTFCGMDAEDRRWSKKTPESGLPLNAKMFGFVARKPGSNTDNACHLFAELDPEQPAQAIVNFVTKVMIGAGRAPRS